MPDSFTQSLSPLGKLPAWLEALDDEDIQFLKRFLLSSGSLKAMADAYGISYPTVRTRPRSLDRQGRGGGRREDYRSV